MEHALTPETLLRHEAFVLRLARTLVRGEADAQEIAQRTLASAVEHPPEHGGVRAWLARVTRNHALDLHRSERRRAAREAAAARPEAQPPGDSAMERLEMESGVVRAVLSLDEPYKSVVVATYYEGLAPAEIAARRGVPAGSVRSQLARAHELLRAKLDREHGERASWMRGLTGLLALRDGAGAGAASASSAASGLGWPLAIGAGLAACVAGVFVVRAVSTPPHVVEMAAVEPLAIPAAQPERALGSAAQEPSRTPIDAAAVAAPVAASGFVPADEPAKLLEQSRQIKKLILDRRLAVTPDERARAGIPVDTGTTGVVRLLDRNAFGYAFSLPRMREGGAYYSFTERAHDFNRRPQVSLEGGVLGSANLFVDLGDRRLAEIPAFDVPPSGLSPVQRLLWDVAWIEAIPKGSSLSDLRHERLLDAVTRGELDEVEAQRARDGSAPARSGRAYLARAITPDEFDVLVALEVIAVAPDQCTIAYRILRAHAAEKSPSAYVSPGFHVELPPPAELLARMSETELRAALDAVRARTDEVLFQRFSPEIEGLFGSWRDRRDGGLVRLAPYFSELSELTTDMAGRAHYGFLTRSHDQDGDVSYQGRVGRGELGGGLAGGTTGLFVDLGTMPLESVTLGGVEASGDAGRCLASFELPHGSEFPAVEPARQQAIRAAMDREREAMREFQKRARELGIGDRARAFVGRTFALRSVDWRSRDLLAAVHVVAEDEHGVVIAWKLLKTWPVPRQD
jgi:RNA polymerase sigma-70 factor (ECF subfamily)